jgi:hypothetical protein
MDYLQKNMKHLTKYKLFESESDFRDLYNDIDVLESFKENLETIGIGVNVYTRVHGSPVNYIGFKNLEEFKSYLITSKNTDTITYSINFSKDKGSKKNLDEVKEAIEELKGKLSAFSYCRIDSLSIKSDSVHSEQFMNQVIGSSKKLNKNQKYENKYVITEYETITGSIQLSNLFKSRPPL